MQRRVPDIAKIGRLIGWAPRIPPDETLAQVIEYEKASERMSEQANRPPAFSPFRLLAFSPARLFAFSLIL